MEDLIETVMRGNVSEVKIVLASVVAALAFYQVFLMAVGYGKLRLPFLKSKPASFTHRAVGDAIVIVTATVAFMCILFFGFEDDDARIATHVVAGSLLLVVFTLKIVVVRWWHSMSRYLPALGLTVFGLFVITWLTSAGALLWGQ